jgi:hypothetical protein
MTPEGAVKRRVKQLLADYSPRWEFWPVPAGYGRNSVDCELLYRGQFFAIECKAPGKKPTAMQLATLQAVVAAGGRSFVIDGSDALARLEAALDEVSRS